MNTFQIIHKGIRLSLAFACTLHLSTSTALCGHFDLDDIDKETYKTHYNNLPSVEGNDALLKSNPQFNSFLKEAEEIVTRYELEATIGLRLIHRHFTVGENQVMAEGYDIIDEVPSLVTYAHSFEEAKEKGAVPASWIFSANSQDEILPFETSNDPAIKASHLKLQQSPAFFNEMSNCIKKHSLNHLLSVAVLKRDSLLASDNQRYMEVNSLAKGSVVQLVNETDSPLNTIRTSWSFKGPQQHKCLPLFYCIPGDGHIIHVFVHVDHFKM